MTRGICLLVMLASCGGPQVRTEAKAEEEVTGSCGSYDRQCDECLETLREQGRRIGLPIADRTACPACNQLDSVCGASTNKSLKAWTGPLPEPKSHEEEPETESQPEERETEEGGGE